MQRFTAAWGRLFPNPGYFGWVIVGIGFLCSALSSPGQSFAISLYLDLVMADLGLSRVQLSSIYATATLLAAACLPFVGSWADRLSGAAFLSGVLALLALSMFGMAAAQGVLSLGAAFFFLRLLGQGAIGLGTLTATVKWFRRYRGRALAVVSLGYAAGQLVFPGAIYVLIGRFGWRGSLVGFGLLYLLLLAPLVAWLARERRADDDPLDGEVAPSRPGGVEHAAPEPEEASYSLREAMRMPVFWGMLLCVSVFPLVVTAAIFHQVALFASLEWSAALVPPALMAYALASVVTTYVTGLLLERVPSRVGLSASLWLSVLAFAVMWLPVPPVAGALLFGSLLGLSSGVGGTANSVVWPDYFGVEALGALKGVVNAVRNGATAVGPPLAALLAAPAGSFSSALLVFVAMCAAGAVGALFLLPPGPRAEPAEQGAGLAGDGAPLLRPGRAA